MTETLSAMLHIRVTPSELEALRQSSEARGRSLQDEVRMRLRFDRDRINGFELVYAVSAVLEHVGETAMLITGERNEVLGIIKTAMDKILRGLKANGSFKPELADMLASSVLLSMDVLRDEEPEHWKFVQRVLGSRKAGPTRKQEAASSSSISIDAKPAKKRRGRPRKEMKVTDTT